MTSLQFMIANQRGLEGQQFVKNMLESWGLQIEEAEGYHPDWDLRLANGSTIEIKSDFLACKTGKICLEMEALEHSKADFLAIYVKPPETVYFTPMSGVREFARQWHKKVQGGEFSKEMCLVPRSIFLERIKPVILTTNPQ